MVNAANGTVVDASRDSMHVANDVLRRARNLSQTISEFHVITIDSDDVIIVYRK